MKCPKCGKKMELIHSMRGTWYCHRYPLSRVLNGGMVCDYSQEIKKGG